LQCKTQVLTANLLGLGSNEYSTLTQRLVLQRYLQTKLFGCQQVLKSQVSSTSTSIKYYSSII